MKSRTKVDGKRLAAGVGLAVVSLMAPAAATHQTVEMPVTVKVIANASIKVAYQEEQLVISAADVARGYVQVQTATRFTVATNSRSGIVFEFQSVGHLFSSCHVTGNAQPGHIGADGGDLVQRGVRSPSMIHKLSYRFTLRPEVLPGTYPWPLRLSVRALATNTASK